MVGVALVAGGCADAPERADSPERPGSDAALAEGQAQATGQERVYVDVRTREEFAAGHVEGAINIPHTEMAARHTELEPYADREIVLYCRSGRRSGIAEGILEGEGFENLTNAGGLSDLQARGVPTTR